jgi:hypothetical protein
VDSLLRTILSRSLRRGFAGEPIWLAVAAGVWLVRRARKVSPGQRLIITTSDPASPGGSAEG